MNIFVLSMSQFCEFRSLVFFEKPEIEERLILFLFLFSHFLLLRVQVSSMFSRLVNIDKVNIISFSVLSFS